MANRRTTIGQDARGISMWFCALLVMAVVVGCKQAGKDSLPEKSLVGHWTAMVVSDEGDSVQLIVDLQSIDSRVRGEFDVIEWGVENYPVEAAEDDSVRLHFAGPEADFTGIRVGDRLVGSVAFQEALLPVTLLRTGAPQLSESFLALEHAADDSSKVERLSADGRELRERFNADANKTRLLMLLSPT